MSKPAFRLAMRAEGNKWTAYCASADTMEGAIWMGSIAMGIVGTSNERRRAFIDLMKDALNDFLEDRYGQVGVDWITQDAPESERSGTA